MKSSLPTRIKTLYKLSYNYLNSKWGYVVQPLLKQYTESQKVSDRASWTKLMENLKETGIDWRERRLISKLYTRIRVLYTTGPRGVKIGIGVRQRLCLWPTPSIFYSEHLTKEALEGLHDFKIGGKVIRATKYAGELELLAKQYTVIHDTIDSLIEIGRCYGMEKKIGKKIRYWESRGNHPQYRLW
jgi:hypothetical protein